MYIYYIYNIIKGLYFRPKFQGISPLQFIPSFCVEDATLWIGLAQDNPGGLQH